jgi:hypothetical protein
MPSSEQKLTWVKLKSTTNRKMMLDQESLRPVIIAMALYITINILVPRIVTKPSGIQVVDDLIMKIIAEKDSMMSGTILIGLIVLATNYIQDELF